MSHLAVDEEEQAACSACGCQHGDEQRHLLRDLHGWIGVWGVGSRMSTFCATCMGGDWGSACGDWVGGEGEGEALAPRLEETAARHAGKVRRLQGRGREHGLEWETQMHPTCLWGARGLTANGLH